MYSNNIFLLKLWIISGLIMFMVITAFVLSSSHITMSVLTCLFVFSQVWTEQQI